MSKHTPGPWHWSEGWGAVCAGDDPRNPDMLVTPIWRQGSTAWGDEENNANARLLAAAPDLLEALNRAMHWMDCHDMATADTQVRDDIAFARAAIKKAEAE